MTEENKSVKKFPNLRFPGFEDSWEERKLGEIGELTSSKRIYLSDYVDDGIPFYRGKEISELKQKIQPKDILYISSQLYNDYKIRYGVPEINDILITAVGTLGNILVIKDKEPFYFKDGNLIWFKNIIFDSNFVAYLLEINKKGIELSAIGSSQKALTMVELKKLSFQFPSIAEQNKIASFLLFVDERIQTQKKIIEDLQLTKKEISFKLFKDGFNSSESKKRSLQKLGDVTYIVNKKNKENLKLPVYSINNKKGFVSQSEQFEGIDSDERGYDISLYKIIDKETFAYNPARINVGSIGYSGNLENIIISSLYVCFKTTDAVDDGFLFQYLRTDIFRKEVLRNVEGGVRDYLFYENFSRIKINLPDIKEQTKITKFLYKLDEKINLETELLTQYENQKKYLLQNLFI
ncbi:hypothetical protein CMU79_01335 [Elizabethkingia anophelis]|nr:hypothetical protein [Elizabethkingia anophelis]